MTQKITVYSKPDCVQCDWTYKILDKADAEYGSLDITEDEDAMQVVKGLNYLAAPVVVIRDDAGEMVDHWKGFQPDKIKQYA